MNGSAWILIAALIALPSCAQQQAKTWQVQWQAIDILEAIQFVQEATGKVMVIDPRVKGQVTVLSDKDINQEELYQLFLATLEVNGFAAYEVDGIVRIVPSSEIKTKAIP